VAELSSDERVVYHLLMNRRSKRSSFTDLLPVSHKNASRPPVLLTEGKSKELVYWGRLKL